MSFFKKELQNIISEKNRGFAIPQILILGIGIAVGVSGLMAASILGLTGSKITRQELLAKSSSYSGITKLRALFNDKWKLYYRHFIYDDDSKNATIKSGADNDGGFDALGLWTRQQDPNINLNEQSFTAYSQNTSGDGDINDTGYDDEFRTRSRPDNIWCRKGYSDSLDLGIYCEKDNNLPAMLSPVGNSYTSVLV